MEMLPVALIAATLGVGPLSGTPRALLIVATLLHLGGVQLPTATVNVPLNNALQSLDVDVMDDASRRTARAAFERRWNRWNAARTAVAIAVSVLLMIVLPFTLAAQDRATPAGALEVRDRVDALVGLALREPMLVEHPSGALFAAGYSRAPGEALDPPNLYRSDDAGRSWAQVDVGTPAQGALGNSDVDLVVGPDGALWFLTMGFDRDVGEGTHVALGVSRDVGRTWTWRTISRSRFDDRPWIVISPGGRAHVIWNDGEGVRHSTSDDGGLTWTERSRIHSRGGSSHLAVGPDGELAVRITPASASFNRYDEGVELIAISLDDGETWALRPPPGERSWDRDLEEPEDIPRWVEPLAWGPDGSLYHLWSEGTALFLGRSDDHGSTWTRTVLRDGPTPLYFPFLVAGDGGELAATWFSGVGDDLRAHVGLIRPTDDGRVTIAATEPLEIDAWAVLDAGRVREPAGEYFPVAFLSGGDLGVLLPIQASERGDGFSWIRISR